MNKYFTYVLSLLLSAVSLVAVAQESNYPGSLNGYFRLSNPDLNTYLTAFTQGGLGSTTANPANASQVVRLTTSKMYSLGDDMAALQARLDKGEIDQETYSKLFQQLMTLNSWKSGFYPVTSLSIQGTDYALFFATDVHRPTRTAWSSVQVRACFFAFFAALREKNHLKDPPLGPSLPREGNEQF